nr:phosphoglucomutase [uncultured bacterium]
MVDAAHDAALLAAARAWIAGDPEATTRAELAALVQAGAGAELASRMAPPLVFGTAGLRARVGAGSARMNRATVIRTTRGLADFLAASRSGAKNLPVVVGHDARTSSPTFAADVVAVLAAARIPVRYFAEPVPTPLVAYAARALAAPAAVVVTASHNPRDDNGYKLYLDDAVQLNAPFDAAIEAAIARVGPATSVPRLELAARGPLPPAYRVEVEPLDTHAWFERYLTEVLAHLGVRGRGALRIAYTPLHGVGYKFAKRALERAGYSDLRVVPEQAEPDGTFPTTPFPNPEEPGTLERALGFAASEDADLLIANDPDADRLAVAVPTPSGRWQKLTGNELGALLADARVPDVTGLPAAGAPAGTAGSAFPRPLVLTSIVTTPLIEAIATARGARFERTLTGFKWLWTAALALERAGGARFAFACEEALGYSLTPAVRDKDGIAAAVAVAELAAACRERGESLLDRLHALGARFGTWVSAPKNVTVAARPVADAVSGVLERAVRSPPERLAGRRVLAVRDYRSGGEGRSPWLPNTALVELELEHGRVLVRPSGTEPKLKLYVDLRADVPREAGRGMDSALAAAAAAVGDELFAALGLGETAPPAG